MTNRQTDPADTNATLSEAARAVVRDAGDPRIDVHLAALGLGPDSPAPAAARRADGPDVEALRAQVALLESALASSRARIRTMTIVLVAVIAVAVVVALVLLAARPS